MAATSSVITVYGYVRVSTDNQLENYSIEEQSQRIKSYCKAKGWILLNIYTDGGYSGGNTNRPALKQMLSDIKSHSVDAVVVYKLDRLSRSQKDTLMLIEDEFLSNNIDFVSINENFDTSSPFGRAIIGILSVFAQLEKDQITERFTMGRIGRGKAGYFHGGGNAPTGYHYLDGELIVNEYEAMQIQEVFQSFLNGKSINAIQKYLSGCYTTKWSATKVRNVLSNSLYIGKVKFLGHEYEGKHQPIIDEKTFDSANQILSSSLREATKTTAQKNPFRAGYLLSGLVYCARCGARYSANHGFYKCYSRAKSSKKFILDPNCKNTNWEIDALDQLVSAQVELLVSNDAALNELVNSSEKNERARVDKDSIMKECSGIERQIERLVELYQVGGIPMESVTKRVKELTEQKETLERKIQIPDEAFSRETFLSVVTDYKQGFQTADTDKKRALLSALVERVLVDGDSVTVHWRI